MLRNGTYYLTNVALLREAQKPIHFTNDLNKIEKSFGIIGIRERVEFFGGDVKIEGGKNRGTTVQVQIPIQNGEAV